jgi:hypothetical protein
MIHYRKHKSGREFYRVDVDLVIKVLNKAWKSSVEICEDSMSMDDATDHYYTLPSTEQEFKEELQVALERINQFKI